MFTVLLILALVGLITACALLYVDISRYEAFVFPQGPVPSGPHTVVAAAAPIAPNETGFQVFTNCLT